MTATAEGVFSPALRLVTIGLLVSVGIVAFDGLGVTTALPAIASELGGMATYGWAVSALMLASVAGTVIAGFLADRHNPRGPYLAGFGIFTAGLVVSGLATGWAPFLLGRVIQGFGVGAILSMAYVFIGRVYPPELQSRALALLSGAWTVPALVGPLAASVLTEVASWRVLFLALIPIVGVTMIMTTRGLPELGSSMDAPPTGVRQRLAYSVLLAASAAVLLFGLEQRGGVTGAGLTVVGLVGMFLGLRHVLPAGTLRLAPGMPSGIATRAVLSLAFFGIEVFLPLAMTQMRGASLLSAGLTLAAGALVWVAGSMVQSRREQRVGSHTRRGDSIIGLVTLSLGIGIIAATLFVTALPIGVATLGWAIGGFGMGMAYNATTAETFAQTEPAAIGAMSGTIQMAQTLATALIAGIGTAILAATRSADGSPDVGVAAILTLTGALALATIPVALRISARHTRPAKAT